MPVKQTKHVVFKVNSLTQNLPKMCMLWNWEVFGNIFNIEFSGLVGSVLFTVGQMLNKVYEVMKKETFCFVPQLS